MATISEVLDLAVRYHQSGDLQQAETLYRQVLQADPAHAAAHHLLGVVAHQAGHPEAAVALLREAIVLDPGDTGFHINLGIVLMSQGQPAEAAQCFRQALHLTPLHADGHFNLGNALKAQGNLAEACACYQQALRLNPLHADGHFNLGNVFKEQEHLANAIASYQQALHINPNHIQAQHNLGVTLRKQGHLAEAALCYRQVLLLDPANPSAHYNLGNVLKDQGLPAEAALSYRQALAGNPQNADAHNNLGIVLKSQGQLAEALLCYRQALRINPQHAEAHNNLGTGLEEQGELVAAAACYRKAIQINPHYAEAPHNLSIAVSRLGLHREALEHNEQALRINPVHPAALWQRSLLRLLEGNFEGGWQDYEQRWALPEVAPRSLQQPRWDGSSLNGKTILVFAEQGLGDTIQFVRYLPMVKERGGTVLFECQPALASLCARMSGVDQFVARGTPLPSFDVQVPLLSLPGIFGTNLDTIPASMPYLRADPRLMEHWRREIEPLGGFKVGIAWQGSPNNKGDRFRSIPLRLFENLTRVEGVRALSLQVGLGTEQMAAAPFPVIDLGSRFDPSSLEDLAAVLMNLDLVVTVDSAVAHLAGAMALPVWVALPIAPDWRWLLERADSPWYHTLRLYRQRRFEDWSEVFERMGADVHGLIEAQAR